MKTQVVTVETMEADHRVWLDAYKQWCQDIQGWQAEHRSAVDRLARIQVMVQRHGARLQEYATSFRAFEETIRVHDRDIAQQYLGTSAQPQDVVADRHLAQADVFRRQQDAHERIKGQQEVLMAQLRALDEAVAVRADNEYSGW